MTVNGNDAFQNDSAGESRSHPHANGEDGSCDATYLVVASAEPARSPENVTSLTKDLVLSVINGATHKLSGKDEDGSSLLLSTDIQETYVESPTIVSEVPMKNVPDLPASTSTVLSGGSYEGRFKMLSNKTSSTASINDINDPCSDRFDTESVVTHSGTTRKIINNAFMNTKPTEDESQPPVSESAFTNGTIRRDSCHASTSDQDGAERNHDSGFESASQHSAEDGDAEDTDDDVDRSENFKLPEGSKRADLIEDAASTVHSKEVDRSHGTKLHPTLALYKVRVRTSYTEQSMSSDAAEVEESKVSGDVSPKTEVIEGPVKDGVQSDSLASSLHVVVLNGIGSDDAPSSQEPLSVNSGVEVVPGASNPGPVQAMLPGVNPVNVSGFSVAQRRADWAVAAGGPMMAPVLQPAMHAAIPQLPPQGFRSAPLQAPPLFQQASPFQQPFRNTRNNFQPQRQYNDPRDDFTRLTAENMKLRQDLATERESKRTLHTTIEAEIKQTADKVMQHMILSVFHENMSLAKKRYQLEKREIELQHREAEMAQAELFLSVGQKILKGLNCDISFQEHEREDLRSQVALELNTKYKTANARLHAKFEELTAREERLKMMERNWMLHHRDVVLGEARKEMEGEIKMRLEEVADVQYKRGLEHGREDRHARELRLAKEEGYKEGKLRAVQDLGKVEDVVELVPGEMAGDVIGAGGVGGADEECLIDL